MGMLWAQFGANPNSATFWIVVAVVILGVLLVGFLLLMASRYKRCPSNRVLVIYGRTGHGNVAKTIHGGAAFVIPLVQDYAYLSLEPIQIEVPLRGALSMENIRVSVPSVFTVAIGTTPEVMSNAAIRLLGLNVMQVKKQAEEIIFGQLRQVIASMRIEDINRDRETFQQHIAGSLEPELKKVGLVLINVNITDITDESGYIDAIGQKAASTAIQQARGDVAEQERSGEIRVAEQDRDKAIQVSNAVKMREIGMREAAQAQAVRVASLDKEQKIAEQQANFERESAVKLAEQDMRVKIAQANASAIDGENIANATIAASQADLMVKRADAYKIGETRKREAEAAVMEVQNRAMAKAALADAERVEAERRAEVEAPARADKARIIVEAEASAERRRIEAEGEAKAIFAKLEAEARGQYEIMAKKGEGLREIISACGGANEAFQLLMLEHFDNLVDASARAISNIKFDKVIVWENGGADGKSATTNFLQNMARTLPPMMQVLKEVGGIELPETLMKMRGADDKTATPGPVASTNGAMDGKAV
jgi:flotillin